MKKVIVIGGGASGIIAAYAAATKGYKVKLIEKNERLGKKLLITGKGRCNITNHCDTEELILNINTNSKFLYSSFNTFNNFDLIDLLNNYGLETKVERGNRVFPKSDKSSDVVKCLIKILKNKNVDVILNTNIEKISIDDNKGYIVYSKSRCIFKCDSLIIATGGLSYPKTGSTGDGYKFAKKMGHTISDLKPSLVGLEVKDNYVHLLEDLSLRNVSIDVYNSKNKRLYSDFGEMEFTEYGIDGPIIKSASCKMKDVLKENYYISLDLKPALDVEKLDIRVQKDFKKFNNENFENSLINLLPSKMIPVIVKLSEIDKDKKVHQITKEERKKLVDLLKKFKINIKKFRPIDNAIITSGGINVKEINSNTMESKLHKNLYFCGEVLDLDGFTGGFNLQIAFSTGYLAGISC